MRENWKISYNCYFLFSLVCFSPFTFVLMQYINTSNDLQNKSQNTQYETLSPELKLTHTQTSLQTFIGVPFLHYTHSTLFTRHTE